MNRMRLIDADELIKRIGKWMPKDPCGKEQTIEEVVATDIAVSVCMEIEETPTAFDKEKVIEKLNTRKEISDDKVANYSKIGDYGNAEIQHWVSLAFQEAIEIVEKGGIE